MFHIGKDRLVFTHTDQPDFYFTIFFPLKVNLNLGRIGCSTFF